ncbi:MAG TPA: energy-coupling factor transporter transmembrane component T [Candidatus Limnocylindria bacterium]|jgi:energy-coupling factor transport system permease protein|nr:energy-coupling factor transporter transmembrane component T [Candidatus Limnocylindria bacterium]
MRAAFRYLGRGSFLARRDPRVLILVAVLFVFGASQLRDIRQLLLVFALALGYYSLASIPWALVRVQWIYLLVVVSMFAAFNAILTGGQAGSFEGTDPHVLVELPFGLVLTAEGVSLALTQVVRYLSFAAVGFPVAYAIAPGDFGVALRRLGLGDRFSVMIDLTVRFVPTLASELSETIDAQRVRGYEPLARRGGLRERVRRLGPLFVPATVGALVGAEDTIDAMDLRGFATGKRTWYRELHMDGASWLILGAFVAFLVVATFLNASGGSEHYLLPIFVP